MGAPSRKGLLEILRDCELVEKRAIDPFLFDVRRVLNKVREIHPRLSSLEDHCLDAKVLNAISRVLSLQGTQLKFQSSSLYSSPEVLKGIIERLTPEDLAGAFLRSWHPIAELERLTVEGVQEGLFYWGGLKPYDERRRRIERKGGMPPEDVDEAYLEGIGIAQGDFMGKMKEYFEEIVRRSKDGRLRYWDFVRAPSLREAVERAYYASFLISYGFVDLKEVDGDLEISLRGGRAGGMGVSVPISISEEAIKGGSG
ncbi:MAG: hypothetical protein QXU06_01025 [Candidatus Bathyarchaeia archaeon]